MDYLNDEEKKKQQQQGQVSAPSGQVVTGQPVQGQSVQAPADNANKVAGSGRFQNLQKFIGANQGAGQQLGSKISQDITKNQQNVQNKIDTQQQNIKNAVEAEKTRMQSAQGLVTQATQDASTFLGNDQNKQQLQSALSGQYQQQEVNNLPELQQNLQGLQQKAAQVGSEGGRFDLLRQNFGLPSYSRGAARLDQLLLQTAPDALNQISSTAQKTSQQQTALSGLQDLTTASNTDLNALATSTADSLNSTLMGDITNKRGAIGQRAQDALTGLQGKKTAIEEKLKTATALSSEEMDALGIPAAQRTVFNELVSLRGPEILNRITVQNADNTKYDITGDALSSYQKANLLDRVNNGVISEMEYRRDPRLQMAQYLKDIDASQFNEQNAVSADEMEDINMLNQLLGKGDVYQKPGSLPGTLGYDYSTAIGRGLSDIAPQYTYGEQTGEFTDQATGSTFGSLLPALMANPEAAALYGLNPMVTSSMLGADVANTAVVQPALNTINSVANMAPAPLRIAAAAPLELSRVAANVASDVASKAAKTVSNAVSSIFCFAKDTMVEMADGTEKAIQDIKLGDVVALGGRVVAHGSGYCDSIYDYKGIKASESHTVYHYGEFMRLKNCPDAKFYTNEETVVYPICTERHLIVSNAKIFTDTYEHDDQDLTYEEIIYELNSDHKKIILVEDYLYKRTR